MAVTVKTPSQQRSPLDVARIRADFPILSRTVNGKTVVYLDNAATSQKPRQVIDAMSAVFEEYNANIHRGVYEFSETTTAAFEGGRVIELRAGSLFYIPPIPHDSWVVGDQPYVSLHFLGAEKYAK